MEKHTTPILDDIDKAILNILQHDSTVAIKDIAEKVGLSATPTYERIKHLEEKSIITKYVALVDRKKIGLDMLVYCNIVLKEQSKKVLVDFEKAVSKIPEIIEVISISGTYDYMLKIAVADISAYNDFVMNVIANLPHVGQYHSSIVMNEVKKQTAYKLP
jgi:Lrp/AsnC family transcriptional regulator, leucine-responsive regulatory protein